MQVCFKNAVQVESVDLLDRAFHYGDGCFSTVAVINDTVLLAQRHMDRLKSAAERLSLQLDFDLIEQSLKQ